MSALIITKHTNIVHVKARSPIARSGALASPITPRCDGWGTPPLQLEGNSCTMGNFRIILARWSETAMRVARFVGAQGVHAQMSQCRHRMNPRILTWALCGA